MRSSFSSSSRSSPSSFSSSSCFPYSLALLAYPHVPPLVILSAAIRIIIVIIFLVLLLHIVTSTIAASTIFDMLFICLLQYPFHFGLDTTLTPFLFFSFHDRLIFFPFHLSYTRVHSISHYMLVRRHNAPPSLSLDTTTTILILILILVLILVLILILVLVLIIFILIASVTCVLMTPACNSSAKRLEAQSQLSKQDLCHPRGSSPPNSFMECTLKIVR